MGQKILQIYLKEIIFFSCLFIFLLYIIHDLYIKPQFKSHFHSLDFDAFKPCSIPDLSFRFFRSDDLESCLNIYREIEALEQIPAGHEEEFKNSLLTSDNDYKFFVIHSGEEQIALCGVRSDSESIFLLYGLIKPAFQKKGLGPVMLALRAQELWENQGVIILSPTDKSEPYYERLGFNTVYFYEDELLLKDDERVDQNDEAYRRHMLVKLEPKDIVFLRAFLERTFIKQLVESRVNHVDLEFTSSNLL